MADPFTTTDEGKSLITFWEGFSATPYFDFHQFSIGFGSGIDLDGNPVTASTPAINRRQAETLFEDVTLPIYEIGVSNVVVRNDLPVAALSALVSFAYNLGVGALATSSLLARIEASKWNDVAYQWSRWKNVTPANAAISRSLCQRRMQEFKMFRDAIVASGLAPGSAFNYTLQRVDTQIPYQPVTFDGQPYTSGTFIGEIHDLFDYDTFRDFCTLGARRAQSNIDRSDWNENPVFNDDNPPVQIGSNPGPFFPNLPSGLPSDAPDLTTEAANQNVTPPVVGNDERKLQPPLVAAGVPVATIATPGGSNNPQTVGTVVISPNVKAGGQFVVMNGAQYPKTGTTPESLTSTKADVFVNGLLIGRTLDPVGVGVMNVGVPNVLTGK